MDIKELKEALSTDEGKGLLDELFADREKGLKSKTEELLGTLRDEKDRRKALEDEKDAADRARKKAEEEAALKSGDVDKIKEALSQKHQQETEGLKGEIVNLKDQLSKKVIDDGLKGALIDAKVAPQHIKVVQSYIKTNHKSEIVDGNALIDGKPLKDFVTEWSQGDDGKNYVAAPKNGGGQANGQNGGGQAPGENKGDLGGDKDARTAAIRNRFPDLQQQS